MKICRRIPILFGALLAAAELHGQAIPMATLTGTVAFEDGSPIPLVRVRAESSALQRIRETFTSARGDFSFALLPPGEYRVGFEASGMAKSERRITVSAGETVRIYQTLAPAGVSESVTVSADSGRAALQGGTNVGTSFAKKDIDRLPSGRTVRDVVLLAPGVDDNGPAGTAFLASSAAPAVMISGAMSFENLYLVNGVVVNENVRGEPHDLFIEDAIAETTIDTGRISAEYGRFTGGVVNVVTRSGGNRLSGSFRTSFANDRWTANDPYNRSLGIDNRIDDLRETYEATLGFPIWKDRIWGFAAGRSATTVESRQTVALALPGDLSATPAPYDFERTDRRLEGKLTAALTGSHNVIASSIGDRVEEKNWSFDPVLSPESTLDRTNPNSLLALNYNGVLSTKSFVEAQYSRRRFTLEQEGPARADRISGTHLFDFFRGAGFGAPGASGEPPLRYDNDSAHVKASYLWSTSSLGQHDTRAGYEWFRESSHTEFDFSRSAFWIYQPSAILRGTDAYPRFTNDGTTIIEWFPIVGPPGWTRLATHSAFLNDRFQWNRHWSGNLGLRYDRNQDRSGDGETVSESAEWSPRLAARFDWRGNGRILVDAGYAKYAAKVHTNLANAGSAAGNPAELAWVYGGPCINCDPFAPTGELVPPAEAVRRLFAWFDSIGGTSSSPTARGLSTGGAYPGVSWRIAPEGLRSPTATEYSIGASIEIGSQGSVRADLIRRDYGDLYAGRVDLSTGQARDPLGNLWDVEQIGNSDQLKRNYTAVQIQGQYRAKAVTAGITYTWSRLTGNSIGELSCCAANWGHENEYPEYQQARWNHPVGYQTGGEGLSPDQRHRGRFWILWDSAVPIGRVAVGVLESLDSGRGYEAVGRISSAPYVDNPGYANPPADVAYFFTRPAAFRTETVTSTDFALTWTLPLHRSAEFFVHAQLFNAFNERAVIGVDTFVETSQTDPETLAPFNPFTEEPRLGVNYRYGPYFGKPRGPDDYQQPRTFQVSIGLRF